METRFQKINEEAEKGNALPREARSSRGKRPSRYAYTFEANLVGDLTKKAYTTPRNFNEAMKSLEKRY
jgi:hypothetical protein